METLFFYPTLGFNLLRNYIQPVKWPWFSRIDDFIVLGGMPFRSMARQLVEEENIGGVVCCTQEHEMQMAWQAMDKQAWEELGVKFHAIPMRDFVGSASRAKINKAVKFINSVADEGKSVYVHCKAGRTRSAMIASCYLMKKNGWFPNVAFEFLKTKRPHVTLGDPQWRSLNEYQSFLDHEKGLC